MESSAGPSRLARAFNFGLLVGLLWLPFELSRVGFHGDLALASAALFVGLGLAIGAVIELEAYTVRRLGLAPLAAAGVYALGSFLATVPIARDLFAGSYAATLPGASSAPYWLPLVAYAALSLALWVAMRFEQRLAGRAWWWVSAIALLAVAVFVEGTNRHTRVSEYPDVHTFLILVVFIATYMALGQLAKLGSKLVDRGRRRRYVETLVPALLAPFCLAGIVSTAAFSLQEAPDRLRLARDGQHSRWLIRSVRAAIDLDRDGHASVFGGPDCDDFDPSLSPDAEEIEGNQVDENCDGRLSDALPPAVGSAGDAEVAQLRPDALQAAREQALGWRDADTTHAALAPVGRPHVVLISVDALRADVLVDTEANRRDFPEFFRLLDESVHFTHAFSAAAGTDLSMSTLMTGHTDAFASTPATLAEHLRDAGWYTSAVVPSEVLRYAGQTLLKRGFLRTTRLVNDAQERDVGLYSSSARGTKLALDNVDRYLAANQAAEAERPLALWVHYFDAHEHDELSPYDRELRARTRSRDPVERYRAAVSLVDSGIGQLRRGLEARGLWEDAVVVLVSDHGESLGEHPRLPDNHGRVLYGALTDIPLAMRVPGTPGRRSEMPASLVDVVPTLLSLLAIEPQTQLDGLDLLPELLAARVELPQAWHELAARPLALYESDQQGVVSWPYKLLWRPEERVYELFDLEADPAETRDLAAERDALRAELAWLLSKQPRVELDRSTSGRWARERAAKAGAEAPQP